MDNFKSLKAQVLEHISEILLGTAGHVQSSGEEGPYVLNQDYRNAREGQ